MSIVKQNVNKTKPKIMASDTDDFEQKFQELKDSVKASFADIYASLKARELKTLRQLDALRKQCQDDYDLATHCVREIRISFENKTTLIENIYNYGAINYDKLSFNSKTFCVEDYVKPEDDHMYLYKTIEEAKNDKEELDIEIAALKQITTTENCVCYVDISSEYIPHKFRELKVLTAPESSENGLNDSNIVENTEEEKSISSESDLDVKKLDPTDDWMNSIKNQIETEPSQVSEDMEHSTITCS